MIEQLRINILKKIASENATLLWSRYLGVLLEKSGAYKSKYTLKHMLSKNMVHVTWKTKVVPID